MRTLLRTLSAVAAFCLAAFASASTAVAHQRVDHRNNHANAVQEYFWGWSDSGQFTARTFVRTDYATATSLPQLVVRVLPADPRRLVYLEFLQQGKWSVEAIMRTSSRGIATMEFDPICMNGTWCDGTYTYRLRIGDLRAPVSVTYVDR